MSIVYSNSPLASDFVGSENYSKRIAPGRIYKFTPHYMAGNLDPRVLPSIWRGRSASSNYGIGSDGSIVQFVNEEYRAWTSSSSVNDDVAITVECANISNDTGELTLDCYESLINLGVDICKRYGLDGFNFTGDSKGNLTYHSMFAATACPGAWLRNRMEEISQEISRRLNSKPEIVLDNEPDKWAAKACEWAVSYELFSGDQNGNLKWHENVTRQEMAILMERLYHLG